MRNDDLSRQFMIETIAEHGVAVKVSGLMEWIYYTDWCVRQRFPGEKIELGKQLSIFLRAHFMRKHEKIIKKIFAGTGLYAYSWKISSQSLIR